MNKDQKILNSINIYNGITKMFNWYINPKNEFTEKDKYRSILALLSTHFLFLKENIIEKKENLNNVSLLHENILESLFTDVLKSFSTIEEYKNLPLTTSVAISIIRNKFAHGDFLYDEINKFVMINLEGEKIKLDIDKLLDFYVNIELGLHQFYKGNTYERNILLNKTKCIIKKPLKTEKEFEEAIKLFTLKTYKLKKNDNEMVSLEMKKILDK